MTAGDATPPPSPPRRLRVEIRGAVQGVGFRPFVYRLATELGLAGWVLNDSRGVFLEVEGGEAAVHAFLERLPAERPPRSLLHSLTPTWLTPAGFRRFEIRHSTDTAAKVTVVLPEIATCADCLSEIVDPADRRHRYPFANCTNCGPRFTIIESLPYDRPNTTMRRFTLCADCRREYEDPRDRRFHAQPNACPECGPRLALWDREGTALEDGHAALRGAAAAIREGRIAAVKGLGGFHLVADAGNAGTVAELRRRKHRPAKPLAVMVPGLDAARRCCSLDDAEAALLVSPEAPIVLLRRRPGGAIAEEVAPGNPRLGLMLPYTPLHHLLLQAVERPVVATSGNLSDEPICTDEKEALDRLGAIADVFLVHDRPITRHVDDSVVWSLAGSPQPLRRARGYAPLPVRLSRPIPTVLAVGAHLKSTVALAVGDQVFLSQHIGDLETPQALEAFERVIADFLRLYEAEPVAVAHDLHPDYASTRWAVAATEENAEPAALAGLPRIAVQHHHAHLAACLAEHGDEGPALGVSWDGTGYGPDGTVWGGELLLGDAAGYRRVGRLRPFRLPGGEAAVREPRRSALALLWELAGETCLGWEELAPVAGFGPGERRLLSRMLEGGLHSPVTTSAGRLFDGVAALVGLRQRASFEGQAAMELEFAAASGEDGSYPLPLVSTVEDGEPLWELDWRPLVAAVVADVRRGADPGIISARFHQALTEAITATAREVGEARVVLTGGCFQNRRLCTRTCERLAGDGFEVLLHRQVPANDGGVSLGQIAVAAARIEGRSRSQEVRPCV